MLICWDSVLAMTSHPCEYLFMHVGRLCSLNWNVDWNDGIDCMEDKSSNY